MAIDGNMPAARIVEVAGRLEADLIVLGTTGPERVPAGCCSAR
ncbi:MAG: hypothetical protein QM736_02840 [Vicinamibacterales bacterium]